MKHLWTTLIALLLLTIPVSAQTLEEIEEVGTEVDFNLEKVRAQRESKQALWTYLRDSRVTTADRGLIIGDLDPADRKRLAAGEMTSDKTDGSAVEIIGLHRRLDVHVAMEHELVLRQGKSDLGAVGRLATNDDGDSIWTSSLRSQGATALRVHFTRFDLPAKVALFLFNDEGQAHGPYTGKGPNGHGEFWSHTVFGDHVWIQLHHFGADPQELSKVRFDIPTVSHLGPAFEIPAARADFTKADCDANAACVVNVNCYDDQPLNTARKALAKIVFENTEGKTAECSGALLNDQDDSDRTPWFLTANHCVQTEASANSIEAFFRFDSPCGSCSGNSPESVLGASLRARGGYSTGDFSLLELSDLPSVWGLMGWTNANVRDDVGTTIYLLSHPRGQPQSISEHEVIDGPDNKPAMIFNDPIFGTPEKGSSGAPAFLAGGKVVGVESGSTVVSGVDFDTCDATTYNERFGAFSYFWKSVRPYLGSPTNTYEMHVSEVVSYNVSYGSYGYLSSARVTLVDELANGIPHATVQGIFSGDLTGESSGVTDENGELIINHSLNDSPQTFTFCVTNVTHDYFNTYDEASNEVTCASI